MENQKVEITSKRYWLNVKDFLRGLLMAAGTSMLVLIEPLLNTGNLDGVKLKTVLVAGAAGGVTYLIKNFFQPPQVKQTITNKDVDTIKETGALPDQAAK